MDLKEAVVDVIRTFIKSYGGYLVAVGAITKDQNDMLAGAAAIAVGLIWSWLSTNYWTKKA